MEKISVEKLTLHEGPLERVKGWPTVEEKVFGGIQGSLGGENTREHLSLNWFGWSASSQEGRDEVLISAAVLQAEGSNLAWR